MSGRARIVLEVLLALPAGVDVEDAGRELARWVRAFPDADDMPRVEGVIVLGRAADPSTAARPDA